MDITAPKKPLLTLLQRASSIAERKSTQPILSCALLTADESGLTIAASDLFSSLTGRVESTTETPGILAVPARELLERVKMMPEGPIVIAGNAEGVTLRAPGSSRRYKLPAAPADDYPPIATPSGDVHEIAAAALADLIDRTAFAVSTDETRAHLNSLLIESDGGKLRAVATDGHRLSVRETTADALPRLLVPLKAVREVGKLASDGDPVRVQVDGASAFFSIEGVAFATRLTDAVFPPWREVVPKKHVTRVRATRDQLIDVVQAVSLAANDSTGQTVFEFRPNAILVRAESSDHGEGHDEVAAEAKGPGVKIGLNAGYVLDALGAVDGQDIEVRLGGELDPVVFAAVGDESGSAQVVMPMRI